MTTPFDVKTNCQVILRRIYRRLTGTKRTQDYHVYYAKRQESDERLRDEVEFAMACGAEYANHVAKELRRRVEPIPDLSSLSILELGPGINFGAILFCAMAGAKVAVFDKYLVDWNSDYHPRFYALLREGLKRTYPCLDLAILDVVISERCHSAELIRMRRGDFVPDGIDFENASFDAVVSNATLEHVPDVPSLCGELRRITRSGGIGVHQVDFRDHSNNERPLDFLRIPDSKYAAIFADGHGGGGNRVRPADLIAEFEKAGFELTRFEPNCFADEAYVRKIRPSLLPRYASMSPEDLRVVGGRLFVRSREAEPDAHQDRRSRRTAGVE